MHIFLQGSARVAVRSPSEGRSSSTSWLTLRLGQTLEFEGESPMAFEGSTGEPQLGLNLMTRRGVCTGSVRIRPLVGQILLDPAAGVVATTVLQGIGALSYGRRLDGLATLVLDAEAVALESEGCLVAITTVQEV